MTDTNTEIQMVCVVNTKAKCLGLPPGGGFEARNLIPGRNHVPFAHIQAVATNPAVAWYAKHGWLEVDPEGQDKREGVDAPSSLATYKPEGAILLVNAEDDPEVLRTWLANEERQDVKNAITARLGLGVGA